MLDIRDEVTDRLVKGNSDEVLLQLREFKDTEFEVLIDYNRLFIQSPHKAVCQYIVDEYSTQLGEDEINESFFTEDNDGKPVHNAEGIWKLIRSFLI
jgi:hypothetical protein